MANTAKPILAPTIADAAAIQRHATFRLAIGTLLSFWWLGLLGALLRSQWPARHDCRHYPTGWVPMGNARNYAATASRSAGASETRTSTVSGLSHGGIKPAPHCARMWST